MTPGKQKEKIIGLAQSRERVDRGRVLGVDIHCVCVCLGVDAQHRSTTCSSARFHLIFALRVSRSAILLLLGGEAKSLLFDFLHKTRTTRQHGGFRSVRSRTTRQHGARKYLTAASARLENLRCPKTSWAKTSDANVCGGWAFW